MASSMEPRSSSRCEVLHGDVMVAVDRAESFMTWQAFCVDGELRLAYT